MLKATLFSTLIIMVLFGVTVLVSSVHRIVACRLVRVRVCVCVRLMREVEMFVELSGLRPYVPHQRTSCSSLFDWCRLHGSAAKCLWLAYVYSITAL